VSIFVLFSVEKPIEMPKGNEAGHGDGVIFEDVHQLNCIQHIN